MMDFADYRFGYPEGSKLRYLMKLKSASLSTAYLASNFFTVSKRSILTLGRPNVLKTVSGVVFHAEHNGAKIF